MSIFRPLILFLVLLMLSGCSGLAKNMAADLAAAMKNSNDLETVRAGSPSYLIMLDAFLEDDPDDEDLLRIAADLNATYAEVFITEPERARLMTQKAFSYANQACCHYNSALCNLPTMEFQQFSATIDQLDDEDDLPFLFTLGSAWVGWIQSRHDEVRAVAQISRIEKIMTKVVALDETYQDGSGHIYLGALAILLPPSLGGKPEKAKHHFQRAIELGGEHNLMAKVLYAQKYGRMMFDQQLHDRLLIEVLAADPNAKGYTLSNVLAQQRAKKLITSGADYF